MRTWLALFLISAVVWAQEPPAEGPATEEPKPKEEPKAAPDWGIERPESNPVGEPVTLKMALEPGKAHVMKMEMGMTMTMPGGMGKMDMVMGMDTSLRILKKTEAGHYEFELPIEFTKMSMNGMDMLETAGEMLGKPVLKGKLDEKGTLVPGTLSVEGGSPMMATQLKSQMEGQLTQITGYWPEEPKRLGESWEVPMEMMSKALGSQFKGGEITGKVYQVLERFEEREGIKCALVRTIFAVRIKGDSIQMQEGMPPMKADIRGKGSFRGVLGLDGYQRDLKGSMKLKMLAEMAGMGQMNMDMDMDMTVTGGPAEIGAARTAKTDEDAEAPAPAGG